MTQIEVHESAWQRWGLRLLPALTFVLGLALSAVVLGALGPQDDAAATPDPAESSASADPEATSPDTVVTVPGACEDASQRITEATTLLDDVVGAVRDFQPDRLVELLNRLEDLDAETRPLAAECAKVDVEEAPSESPSASPSE